MRSFFSRSMVVALGLAFSSLLVAAHRASADNYDVDPVHTFALFKVHHVDAGYVWGQFDKVSGAFAINDDASQDSFNISADADSLSTNNPKRDAHVKGPDFLDAKTFPEITFKSTSVKKTGDDTLEVTGDFSLHGVTKSVTLTFTQTGKANDPMKKGSVRFGLETELTINRTDYGVGPKFGPDFVGNEIKLMINIEGVSAAQ